MRGTNSKVVTASLVKARNRDSSATAACGSGTLTINGTMNWSAGRLLGLPPPVVNADPLGRTLIAENAVMNIVSEGAVPLLLQQRILENAGTIIWAGNADLSLDALASYLVFIEV